TRWEAVMGAGWPEWLNVSDLAREVAERDTRVHVEVDDLPAMTALDRTAGLRILEDIVDHALAFNDTDTAVTVRVTRADCVEVRVIDHGPGISPESINRI